jgi:hypothetical protein
MYFGQRQLNIKPDIILNKRKMSLLEKLSDVLSFFKTKTCAMIGLLMIFTGMQQAVVISDVTMVSRQLFSILKIMSGFLKQNPISIIAKHEKAR